MNFGRKRALRQRSEGAWEGIMGILLELELPGWICLVFRVSQRLKLGK